MYTENDFRAYELYHHGILGMKWGVRNGKNYPLDPSEHSASEKKAGWRKSLDSGSPMTKKQAKQQYRERNKKIQSKYDSEIEKIEKKYKKGQTLSDEDIAREKAASDKLNNDWDKSKAQYKNDRKIASAQSKDRIKDNVKKTVDTAKEIVALSKQPERKTSNKSTESLSKIGKDFVKQYQKETLRRYGFQNYHEAMLGPASTIRIPEKDLSTGEKLAVNLMNSQKLLKQLDELGKRKI